MAKKTQRKSLSLEAELRRLNKNIGIQNSFFTQRQVILRGLVNGLFTAVGATLGFGIVILVLASFLRTISAVPIINDILEQTGISKIIEYQLDEIEQVESTPPTATPSPTNGIKGKNTD